VYLLSLPVLSQRLRDSGRSMSLIASCRIKATHQSTVNLTLLVSRLPVLAISAFLEQLLNASTLAFSTTICNPACMWQRRFWTERLEQLWQAHNVIWFPGVRRAGKTTLCRALPRTEYFDCELPRHRRLMDNPQDFLDSLIDKPLAAKRAKSSTTVSKKRIVLDEVHRLRNPSELLKIAADHYPQVNIVATGSSTMGATRKFRDSLTGRKAELWLTPATSVDLQTLPTVNLQHRLHRGGLPPFLLADQSPESEFQEWMESYWAKDVQELFRLERRHSFLLFVELLLTSSGGIFEATRFARPCEVSRPTIANYLSALETTFIAHVVRPYSSGKSTEIVAAPKVYGFDTGFVCYFRGWDRLRTDDLGLLWEHYVLNEMHAHLQTRRINYWRDKQGHEVDFVLARRGRAPITIECKWSADDFDATALRAFATRYPKAEHYVVAQDVDRTYKKRFGDLQVTIVSLDNFIRLLVKSPMEISSAH